MGKLQRSALFEVYERYGGAPVDFAGWEMPVEYEGLVPEHNAVRNAAGMFDVSHMGQLTVTGKDAEAYIQYMVSNDIAAAGDKQIVYTHFCRPDGTMVDDFLVYKYNKDRYLLIVNAVNVDKDFDWMNKNKGDFDVELENLSDQFSAIALQGPKSEEILQELTDLDLSKMKPFRFEDDVVVNGAKALVSRNGYTGEDGFEVYLGNDDVVALWDKLYEVGKDKGLVPAGLGARDTLRFEANLPLYGNEMGDDYSPLESNLGFFVKLGKKEDFIGKDALIKQKEGDLKRKVMAFELKGKGVPRQGYTVLADGKEIGFVTTGYKSPTVGKTLGKAMLDIEYAKLGTPIQIQIRKKVVDAEVVSGQFLK
ncbi:MAG TPA: glycine cleavage system aminomethyltransferase GcvT [Oscillospiraceae bacterium]|nr:glycine cleavage system aminomethyltransferase GcvT [Oscillospiraceae bacterium]